MQDHIEFRIALNRELSSLGELKDAQELASAEVARTWRLTAVNLRWCPTDPYPETKELVAG
jgi:hypothetical protein